MSSTNKTTNLGLNNWNAADIPKRTDFNNDNGLIDKAIGDHVNDTSAHITAADRGKWDVIIYSTSYYGDGKATRTVTTDCPFTARLAIVFAQGYPMQYTSGAVSYNCFAVAISGANTLGVALSGGKNLVVTQSSSPSFGTECAGMNASGVQYTVVFLR